MLLVDILSNHVATTLGNDVLQRRETANSFVDKNDLRMIFMISMYIHEKKILLES